MTGGRALLTVLALAGTLTLTACTDTPPPPPPPTTTSSTPSTPTPTVTPPAAPSPVKTATGAVSFVRYFWDTYNYAYATGDSAPLEAASVPSCGFCSTIRKDVAETVASKTRIAGYAVTVIESAVPPEKITTGTLVVSAISQRAGTATGPDGRSNALKGFRSVRSTVALAWNASGWHVEAVTNDPKTRVDW